MSIGKVDKVAGGLGGKFEGMTLEQIREKIIAEFHTAYGRYESISGGMSIEICHGDEPSRVHWLKSERGVVIEEHIMDRVEAIPMLIQAIQSGFQRVTIGVTQDDIDRENAKAYALKSALDREGVLGNYYRDKERLNISEHTKGLYTITKSYDGSTLSVESEQTEGAVRAEVSFALDDGFEKEIKAGDKGVSSSGLLAFLGETVEEPEPELAEGGFDPSWFGAK